jgi:hypothetical protein
MAAKEWRGLPVAGGGSALLLLGCGGRSEEEGSVKWRAVAAVTAVPRLCPRRTVRLAGWRRVSRM